MNPYSRRGAIGAATGTLLTASSARPQAPIPPGAANVSLGTPAAGADHRILGAQNEARQAQNPDILAPPSTDRGTLPDLRFAYADAHRRLESGGWTREITTRGLPISTSVAGVNMRLDAGGVRELHWHKQAEWAYMLKGNALNHRGG